MLAGIYYPQGSLKAKLCVQGRNQLYAYCEERGVRYKRIGKILVASEESQLEALRTYQRKGHGNGVRARAHCEFFPHGRHELAHSTAFLCRAHTGMTHVCLPAHARANCCHARFWLLEPPEDSSRRRMVANMSHAPFECTSWQRMQHVQVDLKWLEAHEAKALEPELRCVAALWSENTGIVDSKGCAQPAHASRCAAPRSRLWNTCCPFPAWQCGPYPITSTCTAAGGMRSCSAPWKLEPAAKGVGGQRRMLQGPSLVPVAG